MKAAHMTSSGRKLGIAKIGKDEPNTTVVVATRHYGYYKTSECYIIGCQGEYGVKPGDTATYTTDTGNGYRNENERLDIEDVLQLDSEGNIKSQEGNVDLKARYTYVMK